MKISIITPSLNQGEYINDCIESVLNQNYENFEHIIVDAVSSDSTLSVIAKYSHLKLISEKDNGPAEAINKGFKAATGDIVAWLNADDFYDENVFHTVARKFIENSKLNYLYGNLTFVDADKKILLKDKTKKVNFNSLVNCSPDIRQPCSFFKKDIINKVNYLNENLKLVFDYDLFIKLTKVTQPEYIDMNFTFYRDHAKTLTRKNVRKQSMEIFKTARSHGGKLFTPITKLVIIRLIKGEL